MPPPIPVSIPRSAAMAGLSPKARAFCVPATAKSPSPTASNRGTGLPSRAIPGWARSGVLYRQPGARRDDQRRDAGLQGRMDDRSKARIVVGRDLVELARVLGFRVAFGVGPADEPENRGRVPLRAKRSEI